MNAAPDICGAAVLAALTFMAREIAKIEWFGRLNLAQYDARTFDSIMDNYMPD